MNKNRRKALTNASETLVKPIEIIDGINNIINVSTTKYKDYSELINNLRTINMSDVRNAIDTIDCFYSDVDMLCDEERDYMDNMPENLQNSERYYTAEECVGLMEEIVDGQDDVITNLKLFCESRDNIIKYITEITNAYPSDTKTNDIDMDIIEKVFDVYNNGEDEDSIYMDDVPKDYPYDYMNDRMDKISYILEDMSSYISEAMNNLENAQSTIDDVVSM